MITIKAIQDVYFSNLNAVCNTGGYFSLTKEESWCSPGVHQFSQNKFYFITKGRCKICIDNVEYIAQAGDWFFIPANTGHSYSNICGELFEKYWIHFDFYPDVDLFSMLNLPYIVKVKKNSDVYTLFEEYRKISAKSELVDKIMIKSYLFALIAEYIKIAYPDSIAICGESDERIDEILRFINNNLDQELSICELASRFHLHPNHFIRFFKDKTGETPAKYIKKLKLETAKRLLESTDLYVTEIMEKIGEVDLSQFSKQFKAYYAYSPKKYRDYFKKTSK